MKLNKRLIQKNIQSEINLLIKAIDSVLVATKIVTKSNTSKNIKVDVSEDLDVNIELPYHWIYIERGRKPGAKRPSLQPIMDWIIEKKLPLPNGMDVKTLAFIIINSIHKKGVRARPFLNEVSKECLKFVNTIYEKIIKESFENTIIGKK